MRLLLIEDDPMIGQALTRAFHEQGILVEWVRNSQEGIEAWRRQDHAAVLLDLGIPGQSGVDLLRAAREEQIDTPVLVITARAEIASRVAVLDLGADDYIVKPFALQELFARIRAVLRRHQERPHSVMTAGEITIDLATHIASYRGKSIRLPTREFALLQVLSCQAGKIVSRKAIESEIYLSPDEIDSNAVDVLIHSIRRKFDREIIRNVRGAGWLVMRTAP
ncbi:MAG: response regulator transcription factor [Proteobacteria bacterium]|nr:response regulator transcription factor [Pseudomonadota bacterium]